MFFMSVGSDFTLSTFAGLSGFVSLRITFCFQIKCRCFCCGVKKIASYRVQSFFSDMSLLTPPLAIS